MIKLSHLMLTEEGNVEVNTKYLRYTVSSKKVWNLVLIYWLKLYIKNNTTLYNTVFSESRQFDFTLSFFATFCDKQMWMWCGFQQERACAAAGSPVGSGRSHVCVNSLASVPGREWMTRGRVAHPWRCLSGDVPPFSMFTLMGARTWLLVGKKTGKTAILWEPSLLPWILKREGERDIWTKQSWFWRTRST